MEYLCQMAVLVVFAGGRSVRFGRDKCTHHIGGKRLIDYVIEAGLGVARRVVIAAGQNAALYQGEDVLLDSQRFSGPLAAVDAAVHSVDDVLLFAPCDAPYLKARVFEALLDAEAPLAAWVFPNGRVESTIFKAQPAPARGALDFLSRFRRGRVDDLFRIVPTAFLSMERRGVDPSWFININRPGDLERRFVEIRQRIFVEDYVLRWPQPPLVKWLEAGDVEALREEFLKYVEAGLLSMAAHVAKDLAAAARGYGVLAEAIYDAVDIDKAR
ncbi:molybdenum cofactor guanylyltransferase [Pyrobaculum sp.]|uniref:molybdenum cofactor guanylyltransferase n=1 Tax=Pyrobaculum sp. TaxID=2004705 RepID=UPI003D0F8012